MSIEKQYYIPTIESFHIGFRFEQFTHDGGLSWSGRLHDAIEKKWIKTAFKIDSIYSLVDIRNYIDSGFIRVKSLDHDDIIEAGWELIEDGKHIVEFMIKGSNEDTNIYLTYRTESEFIEIHNNGDNIEDHIYYFQGTVKNYNKLLDVMEMLGIKKEET